MNRFPSTATLSDIIRERTHDIQDYDSLRLYKLKGRIRVDRATPSSNSDVIAGDAEGDVLNDGTYVYTLMSVSGVLKWHRVALAISW